MKVTYYPKVDDNWNKIREFAVAVLYPNNYDPSKKYPWMFSIHGIGERSAGTLENLQNLVEGFDFNGDGIREPNSSFVTADTKRVIDEYGMFVIVPTYDNFCEPELINLIYTFVQSSYSLVPEMMLQGFSLGGGAVVKYITSNTSNANRVAYAIPCAPTSNIIDPTLPGKTNLPVHLFVNTNDPNGPTNLNVTKSIVNSINNSNPAIKAIYTAFNRSGHGGHNEALTYDPPKAEGGQGFTNAGENVYQVYLDILKNGPRQMRPASSTTTTSTSTTSTTTQAPVTNLLANAGPDQVVNSSTAYLDGTKSTGYKSAQWRLKQIPNGVNPWYPIIQNGGWITTKLDMPKEGTYIITLRTFSNSNYTGLISEDDVLVNYTTSGQPPAKQLLEKVYIPKNNNYVYVYDDGTTETKST